MRKILSSRLFRCMICLILVCCFLVNASPIRAKATGVGTAALYALGVVAVEVVVAAAFQALGVMSGSDSTTFRSYVNDAVTWLTNSTTYVTNGMVQVLGFMSPDGVVKSFALKDMIQDLWQWQFDNGMVSEINQLHAANTSFTSPMTGYTYVPAGEYMVFYYTYLNGHNSNTFTYAELIWVDGDYYYYNGNRKTVPYVVDINGANYQFLWNTTTVSGKVPYAGPHLGVLYNDTENAQGIHQVGARMILGMYLAGELSSVVSYHDLTLGQIQSPYLTTGTDEEIIQIEIAPIYVDWTTGQVSQRPSSNDDEKIWLPLGVPSTDLDEIITQNQDQAQSGDTSLDFDFETSTDSDTGTDPDSGGGSGDNTGTGTNTGSGSWTPPSDYTQFQLVDLKNFFPFCIPFDLFRFFELLNAEPEAPVLYWEMQDLSGQVYSVSIDLSEWDSVALLFRRLQLFLFIVGLAVASRKFIKW